MLVLRLFHIVAGALWFGSAFLFTGFVGPAAAETAPASGVVMSAVVKKRRVAEVIKWLAITTVIAGWAMWLKFAIQIGPAEWATSAYGLVLTIGGLLATAAAYFGITGIGNNVEKLVSIGDQVAASGGPPTPEQGAEMTRLGAEIKRHGQIDIVLLFLAVAAMATAQYW
ncbi:MAG TPA: hypothetical protein VFU17_13530, partial [Candidatus Limnocylindrales bacterium]|nr:hypothetical protein [Candidatus Limnocylindrales bacterium]